MNCPYCGEEMVLGYVQSSRAVIWDKEILSGIIIPSSEGMALTKKISFVDALGFKAHLCEKCQVLISKLNEKTK